MIETTLILPEREKKPRNKGLTILIDNGIPLRFFTDTINSGSDYIDYVKFGWGTSVVTRYLKEKIEVLKQNHISYFFGGTLFEKFYSQNKIEDFKHYCQYWGCEVIEISNGTVSLSSQEKTKWIQQFSKDFRVFSEVGSKDHQIAENVQSSEWMEDIKRDFDSGAERVITEARESGTSGICGKDGEIRLDIMDELKRINIPIDTMIFEAPNKKLQTYFIKAFGPNVNLANIAFTDVISLETLRLGLRSDTFYGG